MPLRNRFRCNFRVKSVAKSSAGTWTVTGHDKTVSSAQETTLYAPKIMIASGTTSIPNIPTFKNDGFKRQICHMVAFGKHADSILSQPTKHTSVLGGGKSAVDMALAAAKAGHTCSTHGIRSL